MVILHAPVYVCMRVCCMFVETFVFCFFTHTGNVDVHVQYKKCKHYVLRYIPLHIPSAPMVKVFQQYAVLT